MPVKLRQTLERARNPVLFVRGVAWELAKARQHASDTRSLVRLCIDILLFRVLFLLPRIAVRGRLRTVRLDGASITYRLNRGDIQGIREVWYLQAYRVPFGPEPRTVLDLGANIGLTSVWLARTYGCDRVVGVEPDPENVALARRNLAQNGVRGEIIEAAVGPSNGTAPFARSSHSNLGSLVLLQGPTVDVAVRDPQSLLAEAGLGTVDLCKLDIEGGEGPLLLEGDGAWLSAVRSLIAELHETVIDATAVIAAIEARGLRYYPAGADGRQLEFFSADDVQADSRLPA